MSGAARDVAVAAQVAAVSGRETAVRAQIGRRWARRLGWAVTALALGACDSSLSGPGVVDARVHGSVGQVGGVVLDVTWPGAEGFEGRGSTQAYWAPIDGVPHRYRVVLVAPPGEELLFTVDIAYVDSEPPTVTVVEATDSASEPLPVEAVTVRVGG